MTREQAIQEAMSVLRGQGGTPKLSAVTALVDHLRTGGSPETYGERFVQMAIRDFITASVQNCVECGSEDDHIHRDTGAQGRCRDCCPMCQAG